MRLNKFESAGKEPLGQGRDKKAFGDPENEHRVIVERKGDAAEDVIAQETPRRAKGRFYLTKIAHKLFPENIPNVYQAGVSSEGKKTIDAHRVDHSEEHELLQQMRYGESRASSDDINDVEEKIKKGETGERIRTLREELDRAGFLYVDWGVVNYTKDSTDKLYYLETFDPWRNNEDTLKLLFDEQRLKDAIENITDENVKEKCRDYLDRLLDLYEQERQEVENAVE